MATTAFLTGLMIGSKVSSNAKKSNRKASFKPVSYIGDNNCFGICINTRRKKKDKKELPEETWNEEWDEDWDEDYDEDFDEGSETDADNAADEDAEKVSDEEELKF